MHTYCHTVQAQAHPLILQYVGDNSIKILHREQRADCNKLRKIGRPYKIYGFPFLRSVYCRLQSAHTRILNCVWLILILQVLFIYFFFFYHISDLQTAASNFQVQIIYHQLHRWALREPLWKNSYRQPRRNCMSSHKDCQTFGNTNCSSLLYCRLKICKFYCVLYLLCLYS